MKGKPWPVEDEKKLKEQFASGNTDPNSLIPIFEGRYTKEAIRQKMISLGLEEQQQTTKIPCCSLELPQELPTVEQTLKTLHAVITQLQTPGLDRSETQRLRTIIQGLKIYKEILADFANYRAIEERLDELEKKYDRLSNKKP